ncbi:NUDIX hydrolase [Flagellimonas allohymeniacidonis]|nr:NUDIX domain-containing protein [Allomuricauda hymeniacidonis]
MDEFLERGEELFLPNLSLDIAIMGFQEGELKILLLEFEGKWTLPGGYVGREESTDYAAVRVLEERTGLKRSYLKLFQVFGNKDRSFTNEFEKIATKAGLPWHKDLWINQRFVSLAYYALVDIEKTNPTGGEWQQAFGWHNLKQLPPMWMDHGDIAEAAMKQLQRDITLEQISFNLLPEEFTMPELHQLHETILDKKLERSRFQKKMLSLGIFERLPKPKADAPRRKPYLYRVKE